MFSPFVWAIRELNECTLVMATVIAPDNDTHNHLRHAGVECVYAPLCAIEEKADQMDVDARTTRRPGVFFFRVKKMRQNNNNKFKERRKINTRRKSASVPGEIHRLLPHIFFEIFSSVFFCFFFFPALLRNISGLGYERKKTQGAVRNDNKAFLERKRK